MHLHFPRMKRPPAAIRALIVDDEPQVRTLVERVLHDSGYVTATATDGRDALVTATRFGSFDLLVTDVRMPNMSGPALAQTLRRQHHDLKVLYLTAYNDQLFKERTLLWEDEAFLDKPYSCKGLLEAVSLLMCGRLQLAPSEPESMSGRP